MSLKLSPKARQRLGWMDAYRECGNAAQVCRHYNIPLRTFWRWKKRFDPWDLRSLEDRSRRPKYSPKRLSWDIEKAVLDLKREHPRWGKEKLALALARQGINISGKSCWRICRRHSLIVRYKTKKRRPPKSRVDWAKVALPGDLVELDTKHVSLHGRRLYQYTAIDVVSRWRYAEIYTEADMKTTIRFLETVCRKSDFAIRMIQSDNGPEFGSLVTRWCSGNQIKHVFSHKSRPVENGHVERSHRIDEEEFYSIGSLGSTLAELRERFASYLEMYNYKRPHWGLGGKTPAEALAYYSLKEPCHMSPNTIS